MSTLGTFIQMFETFVNELVQTYPDHEGFRSYQMKLDVLKKANPRKVLQVFMEHVQPYSEEIQRKDEAVIIENKVKFLQELQFCECWKHPNTTAETKEAIWSHLSSLLFFGTTISQIPEGLMNNIEALAEQYVNQMDLNGCATNAMAMDPEKMMENMQNMMNLSKNMKKAKCIE
jgi:hypothetical protein